MLAVPPLVHAQATSKIVFVRPDAGAQTDNEIWIADETGLNEVKLTDNDWDDVEPSFCDGQNKVVFSSNRAGTGEHDVWVMLANGAGAVNLTPGTGDDREPDCSKSLSPAEVVFQSDMDDPDGEIYRIPLTGGTAIRLTDNLFPDDDPTWCGKDDEEIVFARQVDLEGCLTTQPKHGIVMDRHGQTERQLTCGEHNHSEPSCSPMGDEIAFRYAPNCGTPPANAAIHKMAATCTTTCTAPLSCSTANCFSCGQTPLTEQLPASNNTEPRWSLSGGLITFASFRIGPEDGNSDWEIYKMDRDGEFVSLDQVTTNHPDEDRSPDWSEIRP